MHQQRIILTLVPTKRNGSKVACIFRPKIWDQWYNLKFEEGKNVDVLPIEQPIAIEKYYYQ
jgi:hypothetical protein